MPQTPSANTNEYLLSCVSSLRASTQLLDKSIKVVDASTKDVHRLNKILKTDNVFGLVAESDLQHSIKTVQDELEPKVDALKHKYEQEVEKVRNRTNNLKNKIELQRVRLQTIRNSKGSHDVMNDKLLRLNFLRNKKSRLKFNLSRYQLEDQKNRLSAASTPQPMEEDSE
ncbi:hypothetical protein CANTEDRAFT_101074 [Yamadazyma tenuis ATCC 10573]|uniref:DASH complex subunit SPC19 n=2 Tax=Candida tenuis TaxID=2315449 RepID=G3AX66_CANTC|nr:uncharacterized protein CANTEDRAFT_101074 [Yamadazyma tenuis ATCC 10573]EGV66700.1 hypothetical protein CANTEDRAFT_101074 [Yamadazyma tenuis ATCC 10573]